MNAGARQTGFADVDYDEAMRRARGLLPLIREQAAAGEDAGELTPPVLDALHASGLFRYHQPKRWGGMELDFRAFFDIPKTIGEGDASTGWTFANLSSHQRQLSLWPWQAQEEIWGDNPDVLIASGIAYIQGRGTRVDGGLSLTGRWGFSSGVSVSQWNMLACIVRDGEQPVDWCMCLVPARDYEVLDDWQTLGMRATASRTVICEDVFVPQHRVLSMNVNRPGHALPGLAIHRNPMYRIPTAPIGGHGIAAVAIGNAQAALDTTIASVKARSTSYTAANMRDFPTVQIRIGMAGARIDAARAFLRNDCLEVESIIRSGGTLEMETKLRYRRNCAAGMKLAIEAIDMLHEMAGANGIYDSYPIQRMFRDAHAAAGHIVFNTDAQLTPWGLVALGGEFKSPTM
jgi:3-hydroxy-9,10-secoandrosta-1,3,5(10)-triene-9,17-dione monooxygenase